MKRSACVFLTAALIIAAVPVAVMAQMAYSQDFEALTPVNGSLAGDGWLNYGNVFDPGWGWIYGYGAYPAVNNIGNWQDITTGQGGPEQGDQQLVVYSDYANGDHGNGNWVESNCYQEQTVAAYGTSRSTPRGATSVAPRRRRRSSRRWTRMTATRRRTSSPTIRRRSPPRGARSRSASTSAPSRVRSSSSVSSAGRRITSPAASSTTTSTSVPTPLRLRRARGAA